MNQIFGEVKFYFFIGQILFRMFRIFLGWSSFFSKWSTTHINLEFHFFLKHETFFFFPSWGWSCDHPRLYMALPVGILVKFTQFTIPSHYGMWHIQCTWLSIHIETFKTNILPFTQKVKNSEEFHGQSPLQE